MDSRNTNHYSRFPEVSAMFTIILVSLLLTYNVAHTSTAFATSEVDPYSGFPCRAWCSFDLQTDEWAYSVIYQLYGEPDGDRTGVRLDGIALGAESKSLGIDITTNQGGVLTIVLQRNFIQAAQNDKEIQYSVLVDKRKLTYAYHGSETDIKSGRVVESDFEIFRDEPYYARVLQIPFEKDTKHIQIIGTWIRNVNDSGTTDAHYFPCERLQDNFTIQLSDNNAIGSKTFDIRYAIRGNEEKGDSDAIGVNDIYIDWAEKALIIETRMNQSGYLTLILNKDVIQSWDDQIKPYNEQAELTSHEDFSLRRNFGVGESLSLNHFNLIGGEGRLLNISLPKDTWEIQITGSWIVGGEKIPDELPSRHCEGEACRYNLRVGDQTHAISYYIFGYRYVLGSETPEVKEMRLDGNAKALIIDLNAKQKGKGQLVLYLPDNLIRSTSVSNTPQKFDIFVDGREGTELEMASEGVQGDFKYLIYYQDANSIPPSPDGQRSRVIEVHFDSHAREIEIRGTWVASGQEVATSEPALHEGRITTIPTMYLIGIGAAVAGIVAFLTLRRN